ncbi:DUF4163 domain-containing protein [Paenibacillus filicis]|uniref:DUF4163 domain-containing protein n=1 Tax=Paenibacillus filicis TaxID=669464 RepID=A0ABU9DXM8_9BACL
MGFKAKTQEREYGGGMPSRSVRRMGKGMLALAAAITVIAAPGAAGLASTQAYAAESAALPIAPMTVVIDGEGTAVPAVLVQGDTYIGLRALNERLGLDTGWDPGKRLVTVSGRGRTLTFSLDALDKYTLNSQPVYGLPAIVQDGSTYLPLRFLLERMGYGISYDAGTRSVHIETIPENILSVETRKISEEKEKQSLVIYYPQITRLGDQGVQDKINAFLKQEADSQAAAGRLMLATAAEDNKGAAAANPKNSIPPVTLEGRYTVTYNEQGRLSLYFDYYSYTGGAHGMTVRDPYTFDLSTGRLLSLQEAAEGNSKYVSIIDKAIQSQIRERNLPLLQPFETIESNRDYFLKHGALVIYFSQYEYTPYSEGIPQFEIPFSAFR